MTQPTTRYLTVIETRDRLADHGITVTDQTLRRWAKAGKLPSRRIGWRFLFLESAIDALIYDAASIGDGAA